MWDTTPWFIGGGAQHSPEVARLLAYAATGGVEGIISPGDLKVAPLDVPGSKVRVLAGAGIIRSRAAGGAQQSYIARNVSEDVVNIAATGSGSGRSDLIVASIEDPFMAGEPYANPADPKVGPYVFTRVIPNVSSTMTSAPSGSSAIALARIDIPANTATITAGMIKDLRQVASPRRQRFVKSWRPSAYQRSDTWTTGTWGLFPQMETLVTCPEWATQVKMVVNVGNVIHGGEHITGGMRAEYGWNLPGNPVVFTDVSGIHYTVPPSDAWSIVRNTIVIAGEAALPASFRGKPHKVRIGSQVNAGARGDGHFAVDEWTTVTVDLEFVEVAE